MKSTFSIGVFYDFNWSTSSHTQTHGSDGMVNLKRVLRFCGMFFMTSRPYFFLCRAVFLEWRVIGSRVFVFGWNVQVGTSDDINQYGNSIKKLMELHNY